MNKEYVPKEIAKVLKELGFNEPCLAWWFEEGTVSVPTEGRTFWSDWNVNPMRISAPLWQQAFRWFRDKHKLLALPLNIGGDWKHLYDIFIYDLDADVEFEFAPMLFESYEDAELECLKQLIAILIKR
jgi:hypothetical protein